MLEISSLKIDILDSGENSFISALEKEGVSYRRVEIPITKAVAECRITIEISELLDTMPWISIAKAVVAWSVVESGREVVIYFYDNSHIIASDYPLKEIGDLLKISKGIAVIDTSNYVVSNNLSYKDLKRCFSFPNTYKHTHPLDWSPLEVKLKKLYMWTHFFLGWLSPVVVPFSFVFITLSLMDFPHEKEILILTTVLIISLFIYRVISIKNRFHNMVELLDERGYFHNHNRFMKVHNETLKKLHHDALVSGQGFRLYLREFNLQVNISEPFYGPGQKELQVGRIYSPYTQEVEQQIVRDTPALVVTLHDPKDIHGMSINTVSGVAERLFTTEENWRDTVSTLVGLATSIFVHIDEITPAVKWELNEIIRNNKNMSTSILTSKHNENIEFFNYFESVFIVDEPIDYSEE